MSDARPLHVQVAEALGWTGLKDRGDGLWVGTQPETGLCVEVIPYGASWCSSGPLLDRITGWVGTSFERVRCLHEGHFAIARSNKGVSSCGSNGPEAIALLVVKLHKEGKLVKK